MLLVRRVLAGKPLVHEGAILLYLSSPGHSLLTSDLRGLLGVLSNNERSDATSPEEFDRINGINYRGCWLCSRAEIKQMLKQEPLATHDGRKGNRGSVVNIASQLGIVGRPAARMSSPPSSCSLLWAGGCADASLEAAYCGSKAAVISMTRCDAIDVCLPNPQPSVELRRC